MAHPRPFQYLSDHQLRNVIAGLENKERWAPGDYILMRQLTAERGTRRAMEYPELEDFL